MVPLAEAGAKMKLIAQLSECFRDGRNPAMTQHGLAHMLAQRIFGLSTVWRAARGGTIRE